LRQPVYKSDITDSRIFVVQRLVQKHFYPALHAHSEYQLFLALQGSGARFIGDSINAFGPGELTFIGPNIPHLWRSDPAYFENKSRLKSTGIVIYFNRRFFDEHIASKEEMIALQNLLIRSQRGIDFYGVTRNAVSKMMKELAAQKGIKSVVLLLQILEILSTSKHYHYISSTTYNKVPDREESERVNLVYEYVLDNFRHKIRLSELAGILCMTPTSFSRYFAGKHNKSFSSFVSEIRIQHACRLLTETNDSIADIAYECGFNTISNFNTQFKKIVGSGPLRFRKEGV